MSFLIALRMMARAKNVNKGNEIERSDEDMFGTERGFYMGGNSFNAQGMPVPPEQMHGGIGGDEI